MKCEEYQILIEDYIDGTLDERTAARVISHTAECAGCAQFRQELVREQELYSRYQRDVEITPLMWTSIESRIRQDRAKQPSGLGSRLREQFAGLFAGPRLSPAFAAVLVMLAIGLTVFVMSRLNSPQAPTQVAEKNKNNQTENPGAVAPPVTPAPPQPPEPATPKIEKDQVPRTQVAATPPKQPANVAPTPAQLVREAEQKYLTAIAMLSRDVDKRRSQLDPMVLARFDASLAEIDRTIKETRQVVKGNPDDPIALQYLLAAYSKKVDVLREMNDSNN
ncbi:MAG TPA: zf-HC2 domain-containing protein [Blastocatellia bacterium]|nr:zf-HC2 domain-containing protein [Blastocatellia bacterium]